MTLLPEDTRPPCKHPRQVTEQEQIHNALTHLHHIRRLLTAVVREQRATGKDLRAQLEVLLDEETAALTALRAITKGAV